MLPEDRPSGSMVSSATVFVSGPKGFTGWWMTALSSPQSLRASLVQCEARTMPSSSSRSVPKPMVHFLPSNICWCWIPPTSGRYLSCRSSPAKKSPLLVSANWTAVGGMLSLFLMLWASSREADSSKPILIRF